VSTEDVDSPSGDGPRPDDVTLERVADVYRAKSEWLSRCWVPRVRGPRALCEPAHKIVFTWRDPDRAVETEVDVTFTPETGDTVVSLTHRGFERLGPDGTAIAARWAGGWPRVMKAFADRARR